MLEEWMKSYRPEELFDERRHTDAGIGGAGARRARGAWAPIRTPTAACCCGICRCPISATTRCTCPSPARSMAEATRVMGEMLRDVMTLNCRCRNFRVFGPDETASNRLDAVFEVTDRMSDGGDFAHTTITSRRDGRVMEVLSEHMCQGWLEGYLLTGRHGFFSCYEAFIHIVDSMFNQHAKWLKVTPAHSLAPAHRFAELSADVARLAAGPQRLQPSGPGLHRPRGQQESGRRARVSAARCQHACCRSPIIACAAAITST